MLIASPFRDFYDSIKAFGIDKTIVYSRKTEYLKIPMDSAYQKDKKDFPHMDRPDTIQLKGMAKSFKATEHQLIIGFCGKLYPVIHITRPNPIREQSQWDLFSAEDAEKFARRTGIAKAKPYRWMRYTNYRLGCNTEMEEFFNPDTWKKLLNIFTTYNVPAFIYGFTDSEKRHNLVLNPRLGLYNFAKCKDPVTAFQEIMMYLSGVLGVPERPTVTLSDKSKAIKAGHDGKYSFRRPPGQKKKKK